VKKVHVIIPVFNGWPQTKRCLDALRASSYQDLEIIVVDHGSTDETKQALPAQYPEVLHILGDAGLWWTGATNLGIRVAISRSATLIMLLNNDCYVEHTAVECLTRQLSNAGEAVIAPVQKDFATRETLVVTATTCYWLGFPTFIPPGSTRTHPGQTQLIPTKLIIGGRGALIPASVFDRVGLFDEARLPHSGSDNDFYLRCRRQGIPLLIAPDATVYVDGTRTTLAARIEQLGLARFWQTLFDRRSHRNIRDLAALFKLHYPIPSLYFVGVALNLIRYGSLYGGKRLGYFLSKLLRRS
jgi:GT2 family glycosyltransferase